MIRFSEQVYYGESVAASVQFTFFEPELVILTNFSVVFLPFEIPFLVLALFI